MDSKNLPSNVKKMEGNKKKQWVEVFNSSIGAGDDEATAFKKANGVAAKGKDYWDAAYNRMDQDESNYKPLSGSNEQACAACRWFAGPNSCTLVSGDISPTGICDYYMAEQEVMDEEPIPVVVVDQNGGYVDFSAGANEKEVVAYKPLVVEKEAPKEENILGKIRSFLGLKDDKSGVETEESVFSFYKTDEGYRFFVLASNNFKDRHKEIITAKAHDEFVEWCDKEKAYPELWIWHAKGSRIGEVDWIDSNDGMLVCSGLIDPDKVQLASSISAKSFDHVSHGFLGVTTKEGYITKYRSYEISLLPGQYAANLGTFGVNLIKEISMPFSDAKRKTLLDAVGGDESVIKDWESQTDALKKSFQDLGIEYKEVDTDDVRAELASVTKAVGDLAAVVLANNKTIDERVEEAMTARVKDVEGTKKYIATEKDDNEPSDKVTPEVKNGQNWFDEVVMGGLSR